MATKGFRVSNLKDFLMLADQVTSPRFVDTNHLIAFFYLKKRIEYKAKDQKELDQLATKGFIIGEEIEVMEIW